MRWTVTLNARTARAARSEAASRFPQGGRLRGYLNGECVYITSVNARGDRTYVATAKRNRSGRATTFVFEPAPEAKR